MKLYLIWCLGQCRQIKVRWGWKLRLAPSVKNSKCRNWQCRRNYSADWLIHQDQEAPGLKFHGFQMLSNVCVGRGASRHRQQKAEATPGVPSVTLSGRLLVWPWAIRFPVGIPYQAPTSTLHPPLEAGISGGFLGWPAASLCLPFFGESINYCQLILVSHHNINWPPATNRTPPSFLVLFHRFTWEVQIYNPAASIPAVPVIPPQNHRRPIASETFYIINIYKN